MKVRLNNFVRRQTKESRFSYYDGNIEVVAELAALNLEKARQGYRPGVLEVEVDPANFFSGVIKLYSHFRITSKLEARQPGEEEVLITTARADKQRATHVDVILYSKEVLAEEVSTDADYEVVSINARVSSIPTPMDPVTMARNFLNKTGGTKGVFSAEQFAESIWFWATHANVS